jgi:hypothetical protein
VPPPLRNPPLLESSEDLASLSNLNEPSGALFLHLTRSDLTAQCYMRSRLATKLISHTLIPALSSWVH